MVNEIGLAKPFLLGKYPRIVEEGGADLNGDGEIKDSEKFGDLNGDGQVGDPEDFWLYLDRNRALLKIDVLSTQGGFSASNIIHRIIGIEAPLFKPEEVQKAYAILGEVLAEVKARVTEGMGDKEKLLLVYQVLQEKGYVLDEQDDISFISNLLRNGIDCDTSSFVVLAVAQELGIPAGLVILPGHTFVRLADRTNLDYGKEASDEFYLNYFAGLKAITTSTQSEIEAYVYSVRARIESQRGNYVAAEKDSRLAIELSGNNAKYYCNRAWTRFHHGDYAGALEDCNQGLKADLLPAVKVATLFLRAQLYFLYGKYGEAKQDCEALFAFNLDPGSRKAVKSLLQGILSEQKAASRLAQKDGGGGRI